MNEESFQFNEDIRSINDYLKFEGYEMNRPDETRTGAQASILEARSKTTGKIYAAKDYDDNDFFPPYREFLIEVNMKSYFSIKPKAFYKYNDKFYIILKYIKQLTEFFEYFRVTNKADTKIKKEIEQHKNLNILLIITSLLQALQTFHSQKIPILHHDLKPGNILLVEYELTSEGSEDVLQKANTDLKEGSNHKKNIFFIQLIDFGYTKENKSKSNLGGTYGFRASDLYLEASEFLSVALTIQLLLIGKLLCKDLEDKQITHNFVYKRNNDESIKYFYYPNKNKIEGLQKIANMLLDGYRERKSNVFDVMDILTDRKKIKNITNNFLNESKIELYFKILKASNITFDYTEEFEEIASNIFGTNYKAFIFTLFHQKNNKFNPTQFKQYQESICSLYKKYSNNQFNLFNEIVEYHCKIDFFCLNQYLKKFPGNKPVISKDTEFSVNSKIFKILTSLDFRDTRSLNHFINALSLSIYSISYEDQYNFEIAFGTDYKAKIGFLLQYTKSENPDISGRFYILNQRIRCCNELRYHFFADDRLIDQEVVNLDFPKDIKINSYELITSSFDEFINYIKPEKPSKPKEEYTKLYEEYTSINDAQKDMFNNLRNIYEENAQFMLFIHYLYFYELRDEKYRIQSINKCESIEPPIKIISEVKQRLIDIEEMERDEMSNIDYPMTTNLKEQTNMEFFNWITIFRLGDLSKDILSSKTCDKLKYYLPTIEFLKSLDIDLFDFHIILNNSPITQFHRIVNHYNANREQNEIASKLQFIESMSYLSDTFFDIFVYKVLNNKVKDNSFLEFISIEKLHKKNTNPKSHDNNSDVLTKISFPFIIFKSGKIQYKKSPISPLSSETDPNIKTKLLLCLVHSLNYLTNIPYRIPVSFNLNNILIDLNTGLPMILLDLSIQSESDDLYDYESMLQKLINVVKNLYRAKGDNNFLRIILLYIKMTPNDIEQSVNTRKKNNEGGAFYYLTFQYIFNLFLDETLNFTFKGTDYNQYRHFVETTIKTVFYKDDQFRKFAYELLGQSYAVKLDYLFTKLKSGSNLTKEKFVDEMNEITANTTLLKLWDDSKVLTDLANLFERCFEEDSYNLVHKLNQMTTPKDKFMYIEKFFAKDSNTYIYERNNLTEKAISNIYHINNNFISPLKYSSDKNLYFKVPNTHFTDDYSFESIYCKFCFYYSLKSALYYLYNYCDPDLLLDGELTMDHIYINEKKEAIVLPFKVNYEMIQKFYENMKELSISYLCYTYSSYIPFTNENTFKFIKLFGMDHLTELNDILNNTGIIQDENFYLKLEESKKVDDNIIKILNEKISKTKIDDTLIIETSSRVNILSPLFIHLLEKSIQSEDNEISTEAQKKLTTYLSIVEIKHDDFKIALDGPLNKNTAEADILLAEYKNKKVVFKKLKKNIQNYIYLHNMKNLLYICKMYEEEAQNFIINEIGFTNFGIIMDYYPNNLRQFLNDTNNCKNGLLILDIMLQVIQSIKFLHSHNIYHGDIKTSNFLMKEENKIYLGDNLNIKYVSAYNNRNVSTSKYQSNNITSLKHQDVYAFEKSFKDLFDKIILKDYDCPMKKYISDSFDAVTKDENSKLVINEDKHKNIEYYFHIMTTEKMYLLPKDDAIEKNINNQYNEFRKILIKRKAISEDYNDFLNFEVNNIESFIVGFENLKKMQNVIPSAYDLNQFAKKTMNIIDEVRKSASKELKELISIIDNFLINSFDSDFDKCNNKDIDDLVYERFRLNKLNINKKDNKDNYITKLKFRLLQYAKQNVGTFKNIIKVMEDNNDIHVGFFYNYILSNNLLSDDIELKLDAVHFFYNYNVNIKQRGININDYKKLIFDIFDKVLNESNPTNKEIFKVWLIGDSDSNSNSNSEPQDINIISLFFYLYLYNQIDYRKLISVFDDNFYKVAKELLKNKKEDNEYVSSLIKAIEFRETNGHKLACIYEKYVFTMPSFGQQDQQD